MIIWGLKDMRVALDAGRSLRIASIEPTVALAIVMVLETVSVLSEALAAATATYGRELNGALSLNALTYFADGDLPNLSLATRTELRASAALECGRHAKSPRTLGEASESFG